MLGSDSAFAASSQADSTSRALQDHVEVHAEDTSEGIILDSQINVFLDAESKTAGIGEVYFLKLSILDLEAPLQNFIGFFSSYGNVHGHLFVSLDAETPDSVFSPRRDRLLTSQILEHFAGCINYKVNLW